jgi:regulator of nucleoside diphosphate kinase
VVKPKRTVITKLDYDCLRTLIHSSQWFHQRDTQDLDALEQEIEQANVLEAGKVPHNVVTMNSRVTVKYLTDGREVTYQIVLPHKADVARNCISVLAPIGRGLLGSCTGKTVEWTVPSGTRRVRVLAVEHQPESGSAVAPNEYRQRTEAYCLRV